MTNYSIAYRVFLDEVTMPPMYGIQMTDDVRIGRISTDYQEVSHLAQRCAAAVLSPVHLCDVVDDFRRV